MTTREPHLGAAGHAEARRRFGTPKLAEGQREYTVEELHEPGARGAAIGAARQGNTSARQALSDFDHAYALLPAITGDDAA